MWTPRTIALSVAGLAMIGGLAFVAFRDTPVAVDLFEVRAQPMQVTIDADGRTRIRDIYEVAAPIAGTAQRAPVAVGDPVFAGETVVARVQLVQPSLLDARSRAQAEAAVDEAAAALEVARSDLARFEEELAFARLQYDRTQVLVERGVSTLTQLETVTQQLAIAEAAVAAAQSRIAMSEGALERAQAGLVGPDAADASDACCVDLLAPSDGVVLSIATISEHPVQAGAPLVSVGDPSELEIVADLLSSDAVRISPGTRALVERWGGDGVLEAEVTRIEPAARTQVSALGIEEQRVDVVFDILSPEAARPGLGHGFAVFMRVIEWETEAALQVPLGALFRRGDGWAVFVVENGIVREQPVVLGRRGDRMAEILEGVSEGDAIITHPSDVVAEGVSVIDRAEL